MFGLRQRLLASVTGVLAAAAGVAAADAAHAQAAAQPAAAAPQSTALEEVVVTARRTEENVQTVPLAVTALSGAQLAQAGVRDIQNLSTVAPGLTISSSGLADRENLNFVIRGQGIVYGQVNQSVITYFDNVPVTPAGASLFFDTSNVQVLKGPQGTLFGKNTTGGAILFEPNRPGNEFNGDVAVRAGNYGMHQLDGYINVPLVEDKLMARLAVNYGKRNGFTHDLTSGKRLDDQDFLAFRFGLVARPTDNLDNYLVINAYSSDTNASSAVLDQVNPRGFAQLLFPGLPAYLATQQARGPREIQTSINNPYRNDRDLTVVNTTTWHATDWLTFKNIFGWTYQRSRYAFDFDGTPFPVLEFPAIAPNQIAQNTYSDEVQAAVNAFNNRLNGVMGYYGTYSEPSGVPQGDTLSVAGFSNRVNNSILRSHSVYLQASYEILPKLRITAGVRRNFDHQTNFAGQWGPAGPALACQIPGVGPNCVFRSSGDWNHTSWLAGVDYKFTDSVMAYFTARNGYKSGGVNGFIPNPSFSRYGPEVVNDKELGVKSEFHVGDMPARLNADIYRGNYSGLQRSTVFVTSSGVYAPIFNAARARVQGIEIDGVVKPASWLSLSAFYDYTDAHYLVYRTPTGVDLSSTPFTYTPRVQYGGNVRADLPVPEEYGAASVTATYSWQAGTHFVNDPEPADIPSYYTLNARLDWKNVMRSPVDLAFFIDNPFNKNYRIFEGSYYASVGFNTSMYAPPRMWGFEARYHFK